MDYIYLHGFASSPNSAKARDISDRFAKIHLNIQTPDLNFGDFSHLTITRQINQVADLFSPSPSPVTLIGSSLGGLTAAWLGQEYLQVQRLVLLAPAFGFLSHWLPKLGNEQVQRWQTEKYLTLYHYGEKRQLPLSYDFVTDASQYQEEKLKRPVPTLILHGQHDEVIPIQASRDFVQSLPPGSIPVASFARVRPWVELVELDSDHALSNVMPEIWQAIQLFCRLP